jgi:threonine/homoserine/homoserine lactone efflux protein
MVDLVGLFGLGFSTGLAGAMIPGPLTLYTISEAIRQGRIAGIKVAAGHLLLEAGFAGLVLVGLRDLLVSDVFRRVVGWVGAVGLMTMGALILCQVRRLSLAQCDGRAPSPRHGNAARWGPIAGGALFSLVSPGFLLWWITIGASVFLKGSLTGGAGVAMVGGGHAVADLSWCWLVALSVERGRAYCTDRVYRIMMGSIALCLIRLYEPNVGWAGDGVLVAEISRSEMLELR